MIEADVSAVGEPRLAAEDCRAQLDRILKSADFDATVREHRFLSYVVEEAVSGRGSRIKAYSIAVEVFGRGPSFDPQNDPIVRVEAGHLRRSLQRYYLTGGQSDPIVITIPKGGYVPTFSLRAQSEMAAESSPIAPSQKVPSRPVWRKASWLTVILAAIVGALVVLAFEFHASGVGQTNPETPRILVSKFEDLSGTAASSALAIGLTQEVVGQLSKFRDIVVVESGPTPAGLVTLPPRFVLSGNVDMNPNNFRIRVKLTSNVNGSVLWAQSYDGGTKVAELLEAQAGIAQNVATTLAQTYGVIFQADAALKVVNPPDDWKAYSCTLSYYAYRADLDDKALSDVRDCLENAVQRFPGYATAWGLLSQAYMDEVRFRYPSDPASSSRSIQRALAAARRAVELDPLNIRARQAEMFALYYNKDVDAALTVGRQALAVNPNDTEMMGEYGFRLAMSGNWPDGCPLVAQARGRNPGPFAYYESALALCSYFTGDYPRAVMWIRKTTIPKNPSYHAIAAAIFAEGGYKAEAELERSWLLENAPALAENLRAEAAVRFARAQDVEFFLGSLKKAGLDVRDP